MPDDEEFMLPREVAAYFRVDVKTVNRWAKCGKLAFVRTPGGHHRYPVGAVEALAVVHNKGRVSGRQTVPVVGGDGRGAGLVSPLPGGDAASAPTPPQVT